MLFLLNFNSVLLQITLFLKGSEKYFLSIKCLRSQIVISNIILIKSKSQIL